MKKFIVASSHLDAGLSNRLKSLISAMRLTQKLSRTILLHWPLNFICGARFQELFETKIREINTEELNNLYKKGEIKKCKNYEDCKTDDKFILLDNWRFVLFPNEVKKEFAIVFPVKNKESIDLEYERTPKRLQRDFLKYVNKLTPKEEIRRNVELFLKKYDFSKIIGLHVRRTEFMITPDRRGFVSTDEKFFGKIKSILKNSPEKLFFLATDSKKTEKNFIREFGNKIIILKNKDWDKSRSKSTRDALIEMLVLSKTNRILGTYLSTFTEMAWWFSGCKAKVEIIGDEKQKADVLKKALSPEVHTGRKSMIREIMKELRRKSSLFRKVLDFVMELKVKRRKM